MCGICGYLSKKNITGKTLEEMRDAISYRGPDDAGFWMGEYKGKHIGLAHRRLSIIDLSEMGHQPMISEDGKYIIVYNGEIYNYKEIRKELEHKGYRFQSTCDTEVVLKAFLLWGTECFRRLNGMFAVVIWDNVVGKLILARDRIGKKPLYYYYSKNTGEFAFASEMKSLLKYPYFQKRIRQKSIADFFCNKYIAAPNTIFEDTYKMIPGTFLEFSEAGVYQERYWNILREKKNGKSHLLTNCDEARSELGEVIRDSVKRRMIADVPVGSFLSGGIDSTLVTALAQRENNTAIKTFSVGFYNESDDEAPFAREIAKYIGTDHTELYIDNAELLNMVLKLADCYDEPFSDASQIPTMAVSKLASKDVKVVITGDGGDEVFCGYRMYDWIYWVQKFDFAGQLVSYIPGFKNSTQLPIELKAFISNRDENRKAQLFADVRLNAVRRILLQNIESEAIKYSHEDYIHCRSWQERRMLLDMLTYLPDEILCKMDRASMYYSIEARCPLLDYRVIEKSFQIPHTEKYKRFDKKHILKELTYQYVPKELLNRPKKGFSPPIKDWVRGSLKKQIQAYADGTILDRQGIFDRNGVSELINLQKKSEKISYTTALWSFFVFQSWYQIYFEDLWGDR